MTDTEHTEIPDTDTDTDFDAAFSEAADESDDGDQANGPEVDQDDSVSTAGDASETDDEYVKTDDTDQDKGDSDIWADAPEPLRAAFEAAKSDLERERQSARSNAGRVSAYQRQITDLRTRLAAFEAAGQAPQGAAEEDDEWNQAREDFPEIAGPLERKLQQIQLNQQRLNAELGQWSAVQEQAYREQQAEILTEQHPDWVNVVSSQDFHQWMDAQPDPVRETLNDIYEHAQDASSTAWMIGLFKLQTQGAAATAPFPNPAAKQKRQRQLQDGQSAAGRGPGRRSGPPNDFDAAFQYFAEKANV